MLEQLQKDWKAAITSDSRRLLHQECIEVNGEKVVKTQKVLFKFRNIEAFMHLDLFRGDETLPREKRRYRNTVQVPSTNKQVIIYPREWKSPVEKMMTILIAFTKGRDHEDRVAIRRQMAVMRENDKIVHEFVSRLDKTTFDTDEKEFISQWLDNNSNTRKMNWNRVLLEVLIKYHQYITGRGLIELGINLGQESSKHVRRCYDTTARIINASTHQNGKRYLPREVANPLFLEIREVPMAIYVVRSLFSKIWDRCFEEGNSDNSMLFAWICDFLGMYYAKVTGIPLDKHCTELQQRFIEASNRRMARKINGTQGNNPGKKFREPVQGPIMTFGDEYGDVLDQATAAIRKENYSKQKSYDKPAAPKNKAYADEEEEELDAQPQQKRKFRPAVITAETQESANDEQPKGLGTVGDAFDKADLL